MNFLVSNSLLKQKMNYEISISHLKELVCFCIFSYYQISGFIFKLVSFHLFRQIRFIEADHEIDIITNK